MQGIYILEGGYHRPASKKEVKEVATKDPTKVLIEATSMFGNEYNGPLADWPGIGSITFVGPDPERSRKFYGTIKKKNDGSFSVA